MTRSVNGFAYRAAVFAVALAFVAGGIADARAADYWWTGTTSGTTWSTVGNWSTLFSIGGSAPSAPGAGDTAYFNQTTVNTAQTVTLAADTDIGGLVFNNTATTTIAADGAAARRLNVGAGGLLVNRGAGAVAIGGASLPVYATLTANQSWNNNSSNTLTIANLSAILGGTGTSTITFGGSGNTTFTAGASLKDGSLGGKIAVVKTGAGVLTLATANTGTVSAFTFSGGLTVNAGQALLQSTVTTANGAVNIVGGTNAPMPLSMGGGTLTATWASTVTSRSNNQSFGGTTLTSGASVISANTSASAATNRNAIINLGAVTRNAGSTVNFSVTGNNSGTDNSYLNINSSSWTSAGVVLDNGVAYATQFGSTTSTTTPGASADNWAGTDASGRISFLTTTIPTYTPSAATTLTGNANIATGVDTTLAASGTSTSLRMNVAEARTVNIGGFTYTTGGILVTSTVAANTFTISNGTLRSAATVANKDLVFILNNSGTTAVSAVIADGTAGATGLTKSGVGTLSLTGANTYTGPTYINGGTILVDSDGTGSSNPLGTYPGSVTAGAITLNGGALRATTGLTLAANRGVTLLGNGGTLDAASGQTLTVSGVIAGAAGSGALSKGSAGGNLTLNGNNTFIGGLVINSGTVTLGNAGALNSTAGSENAVTMLQGATAGVLALNGNSITIADLAGSGAAGATPPVVQNGGGATATLTIGNSQNFSGSTFNGVIQDGGAGALNLVKTGNGTLTLSPSIVRSITTTNASNWVLVSDTTFLQVGTAISGSGIPASATIAVIASGSVQLSGTYVASASSSTSGTFNQRLNTYTGTTTIANGQLSVGAMGLPSNAPVIIGDASANTPGVLSLSGSQVISSLTSAGSAGVGNKVLSTGNNNLTITGTTAAGQVNSSFGGNLFETGAGNLILGVQNSAGSLTHSFTLGGSNSMPSTTLYSGSLVLTNVMGLAGSGTLTFGSGATTTGTMPALVLRTASTMSGTAGSFSTLLKGSTNTGGNYSLVLDYSGSAAFNHALAGLDVGSSSSASLTVNAVNVGSGTGSVSFTNVTFAPSNSGANNGTITANANVVISGSVTTNGTPSANASPALILSGTATGSRIDGVISNNVNSGTTHTVQITKSGAGTWTLAGANTYTGTTTISAGTLIYGNASAFGTGTVAFSAASTLQSGIATGTLGNAIVLPGTGASATFDSQANVNTLSGTISGSGNFVKIGSGTLALSAPNTYTGTTSVNVGTLQIGVGGAAGSIATTAVTGSSGATLAFSRSDSYGGNFTPNISGGLSIVLAGGTLALSGSNTYTGTTTASAGTLVALNVNALPGYNSPSKIVVAGSAALNVNYGGASDWTNAQVATLLTNNVGGFAAGAALGFDTTNASGTFSTNIPASGLVVRKAGSNSLTLSGSNSHSGGTQVNGGTLVVNNAAALGSGTANVNAGTLNFAVSTAAATGLPTIAVSTANGSTGITLNSGVTINNPIISGAAGQNLLNVVSGTGTVNGNITWTTGQTLRFNGGGTLVLNGTITNTDATQGIMFNRSGGTVVVNAPANYVGGGAWAAGNNSTPVTTTMYDGTTKLGVSQALNQTAVLNFGVAGAMLDLNGNNQTIQNVTANNNSVPGRYGVITNTLASSTSTLTISNSVGYGVFATQSDNSSAYPYMSASLREAAGAKLAVVKSGAAAGPTFINTGSYSGGTVINAGSLTGFQGTAFGTGDVTVNAGGLFMIDFSTFATGSGSQTLSDSVAGSLVLAGGSASFLGRPDAAAATFTANNYKSGGGNPQNGQFWVVSGTTTAGMAVGQSITGGNAAVGTYITAILSPTQLFVSTGVTSGTTGASFTLAATTNTSSQTYGGGQVTAASTLNVDNNGGSGMTLTLGSLSGTGGLTKQGSGRLVVNGPNNAYAGIIQSANGTIALGGNAVLANAVIDTSGTGAFDVTNATSPTFGGLVDGSGARDLSAAMSAGYSSVTGITLNVAAGKAASYSGGIADGATGMLLTKLGSGTQTLDGSSTYTGPTTGGAGVLRFNSVAAGSGAQALGAGTVVNLGVASTSAGEIDYYAATSGTLDKNVFALGSGRNRIRNSGGGTLALSGTLTKNGTILELAGGTFDVSGQITGSLANSDLFINGASVTLSNTNNDYNGPTYVYGNGTLTLGASGVIPNGSILTLGGTGGGDIGTGTLVVGNLFDSVGGLLFGSAGGTVRMTASGTAGSAQLTAPGGTIALSGGTLDLTGSGTTSGLYRLFSAQSVTGAFSNITGTSAAYRVISSSTSVDYQRRAEIGSISATPTAASIITGGSTTFTFTVHNATPTDGASLAPTFSAGANVAGSAALASVAASSTSSSVSGFVFSGTSVGAGRTGLFTVNDSNALATTATGSVSVNVYGHAAPSFTTGTLTLGNLHVGYGAPGSSSNSLSATNGSVGDYIVALKGSSSAASGMVSLASISGIAAGGSGSISATLATGRSAGAIDESFTYTFADDSPLSGASSNIGTATIAVIGNIYSGQSVWSANSGGNWGTLTGTGANAFGSNWGASQGSPGLDSGFANTDTATFAGAIAGDTATIGLTGVTPSLKSITFSTGSGSYLLSGGAITMSSNSGTAGLNVLAGSHEIASNLSLTSLTSVNTLSDAVLTLSGAISGSGGFVKIGAGTLNLMAANTYSGNTEINAGTLKIGTASAFGNGGTVILSSGATLDLSGFTVANAITNNGGTIRGGVISGTVSGTTSVSGSTTLDGTVAGTVTLTNNSSATIGGNVTSAAVVSVVASSTVTAAAGSSFAAGSTISNLGQFIVNASGTTPFAANMSGNGAFVVNGGGKVQLTGSNADFSGQTTVTGQDTTLAVNSVLGGDVFVGAGASLGGSGLIAGDIGGDGLISPGNSPGILTVNGQLAATGSTAFAFELSQTGAPNWSDATNSSNDVLRLTASSPFANSLASTNVVNVYFDVANLNSGDTFLGGFFVDNPASTANLLTNGLGTAAFQYFVYGDGNGGYVYNGTNYYSFDAYKLSHSGITGVTQSVVNVASADFAGGSPITTGQVTQFVIIPEPDTIIFAGIGIAMAGWSLWKRRRTRTLLS